MEEKVLCKLKKKSLFALIICAIAMLVTIVFTSPSEFLVTTIIGIYSLLAYLRLKGKKTEVKDLKNLVLLVNVLMICYNLLQLIFLHNYISGWGVLIAFVMLVGYIVTTIYIYELFRGKMRLENKVFKTSLFLQLVLVVLAAILSKQYWVWGNVAFVLMSLAFARFLKAYSTVAGFVEENKNEDIVALGIDEDVAFKNLPTKKRVWKLIGHIVLGIVFSIPMLLNEWIGCAIVAGTIVFVAPLVYIYRLGNAINEPKGMLYISYFIPLVGMILYLIYVRNVKALGNACGKAALLSLVIWGILGVVVGIFVVGYAATLSYSVMPIMYGIL